MSTTLTNGLKLPDKGSVDWYADMQSNYTILDGAVGTVAEHTSQMAGKAPAVHTHTKSDITDLFNSANTWTGDNTYTATIRYKTSYTLGNPPQSSDAQQSAIMVTDSAGTNYLAQIATFQSADATGCRITIRDKFDSNGFSPSGSNRNKYFYLIQNISNQGYLKWDGYIDNSIYPLANNTYNLGSSANQWNNLYAKNYYYNGTAWGLDKANEWTATNTFSSATNSVLYFKSGTSGSYSDIRWVDNNDSHYATLRGRVNELTLGLQHSAASTWYSGASVTISNNGNVQIKAYDGTEPWTVNFTPVGVYPTSNNTLELGTSTHKWKTLNGINPGALSLPSGGTTENTDWYNVAGDILPTGENATSFNRDTANYFTPAKDGWLSLAVKNCSEISVWSETLKYGVSFVAPDTSSNRQVVVPVVAGISYQVRIAGNSWVYARLIMPKGNV